MNSRQFFRMAALAAACVLSGVAAQAQGTAAAGSVTAGKVGVINIRAAISSTAEGKQANAELQAQFAPRTTELDNISKQLKDIQQRLTSGATTLSDEEKARLSRQGEILQRKGTRAQQEYEEDANAALQEVTDRIGRKMIDVLDRYARENGYSAIFNSAADNSPIVYASTQVDVTQDIVRLYDQAYPVKAGATPPAKPAAKPTTPPAQKPQ